KASLANRFGVANTFPRVTPDCPIGLWLN
ncbi:MAG: hypothetical protein QOH28_1087, partial [Actinomycetota bacterium]|nr:hypothetical protein [Actinomycetota bacterium]